MKTRFDLCAAVVTLIVVWGSSAAQAQTKTTDGKVPFGVDPTQGQSTASTSAANQSSSFGQPYWLQEVKLQVPTFAGAGLRNDVPPFLAGVKVDHSDLSYREGDTLSVEFTAERAAYLYLIYHQADGKILLLFPNQAHIANYVPPRQWSTYPAPGDDFRFRISAPYGTEVLQVLATLQSVPELDALVQNSGKAPEIAAGTFTALEQRLKKDNSTWTEHRVPIRTSAKTQVIPTRRTPARVGLFVGVNRFQSDKNSNDEPNARFRLGAELMAKVMLERGQLDAGRTKTITGADATRENIELAITRWLPSVTQPGDTVFLFYAGHGGLVKNLDGTKADGKDGVLTTYNNAFQSQKLTHDDWDSAARLNWISDSTLARWLQELPGRQIVLLISSCHSGSMLDGRLLTKFASRELTRVKGISDVNTVALVSCFPEETTLSNTKKPVWMAHDLAEAMTKLPAPVTLQGAFDYYRQSHRRRLAQDGDTGFHEPILTDTALLPITLVPKP